MAADDDLLGLDWAAAIERAQEIRAYRADDVTRPRLPFGTETFRDASDALRQPCRHCGTTGGRLHDPGCNYEQCPFCGGQVLSCDCAVEEAFG